MKTHLLSALLLFACCFAYSQAYQPFLGGKLHYFTSTTNYSVRVDSVGTIGPDSAFWMNEIALFPEPACTLSNWPNSYNPPLFDPGHEGFFADHFIRRPAGIYEFVSREGDTATFYTLAPIGGTWYFLSDSSLTATLSARSLGSVSGTPDSVITIDISDGHQYQLSEHYGLVAGMNLDYYLHGAAARPAQLDAIPEIPNWTHYISWQPGDHLGTSYRINSGGAYEYYRINTVTSRYESPTHDTIRLDLSIHEVQTWFQGGTYINTFPGSIEYTRMEAAGLETATYEVYDGPIYFHFQLPWVNAFNGRRQLPFYYQAAGGIYDSCGYYPFVAGPCVESFTETWTEDLGITYKTSSAGSTMTTCIDAVFWLLCYEQAGTDSMPDCPPGFDPLAIPVPDPLTGLTIQRSTLTGECSLAWENLPEGTYDWELIDLQGRSIWTRSVAMSNAGESPLTVPRTNGIYLLRISDPSGSRGKTLKVPMLAP